MKQFYFALNFRSGIPVTAQIVEQIQVRLATGELQPGDQLPTVRQLASDLRINFNTVARAYRILDETGLISTQQGRGTYILETTDEELTPLLRTNNLEDQIARFLDGLKMQGFAPEEVETKVARIIQSWQAGKLENKKNKN